MNAVPNPGASGHLTGRDEAAFAKRVEELAARDHRRVCLETDRQFALLFLVQWVFGVVIAIYVAPLTWRGEVSSVNPHVWAAIVLGGLVSAVPAWLTMVQPGAPLTRHAVAVGQISIGLLLIHLTGGRIETHFHVFGSLAFLAAYRDRSVLVTATVLVAADHFVRGYVWPVSVFGVASASIWRPLEHAAWVIFEDIVLFAMCGRANEAARSWAQGQAALEELNDTIEARVERRTRELVESRRALERANDELREATERALESSRAKSAFLATVSHEVRTPMNGIIGVAELLRDTPLENEQIEYVDIIDRSGHALLGIINDILDFSKLEAGKLEVERLEFDLLAELDHVLAVLAPAAAARRLAFGAIVAPDVPRRIVGDAGRVNQVLLNLIGNAVKFTEHGRVVVRISLPGDATKPTLRFDVEDTGAGIAAATLERLFQPFTQADASTTRRFGGTGLGLAICRSLAELLGGTLSATSEPGVGSTFRFELAVGGDARVEPAITAMPPLPAGRIAVTGSAPQAALVAEQLALWGVDHDVAAPGQPPAAHPLVIACDPDHGDVEGLRERAGAGRVLVLRAPFTPSRLSRELAGESADGHAAAPLRHAEPRARLEADAEGPVALVVEDNPVNQRIAIKMVSKLGYRVHTAENGVEATRKARSRRYDVILMDCQMPEMDGYDATRAIRDLERTLARTPIIAVTANAMSSDRERCLAAGMDDFLSKPLTMAALQQAFERLVDRSNPTTAEPAPLAGQGPTSPTRAPRPSGTR